MNNVLGLTQTIHLRQINCGSCGGVYAINDRYHREQREIGSSWTCPYCKCDWGFSKSENSELKKQLEAEKRRVEFANDQARMERERRASAERRESAQKAAKTRLKNRVKHGVCPCCNRTFAALQTHMKNQHPEYVAEKE